MLPPGPIDSSSKEAMGGAYPLASGRPAQTGPTFLETHFGNSKLGRYEAAKHEFPK